MKLEGHLIDEHELGKEQIEVLAKQKQEYKFIGSLQKRPGHTLFSFNPETEEVEVVKIVQKAALTLEGEIHVTHETQFNPKFMYVQALNKKNALRKFKKQRHEI